MTASDPPRRPQFKVIEGAWISEPAWLEFPSTLRARSPNDRSAQCRVRVSRGDVTKAAAARRRQPAYELWSVLAAKAPPVPHGLADAEAGLTSLFDAHACFRGLKRPLAEDGNGGQMIAYVIKPHFFFAYQILPPLVVCEKREVPVDLVFVAYVRLDEPNERSETKGVLTHWHFVNCDDANSMLPQNYDTRYEERLW